MKLVVGLGNPGERYIHTRHNIGFRIVEQLLEDPSWRTISGVNAFVVKTILEGEDVVCVLPQTYMNLSGVAVEKLLSWYKIDVSDTIVVHDELDLEFGRIQVRKGGGDAGHNGVKSLIEHIGGDFIRVRVGIGRPENLIPVEHYVLEKFSEKENAMLPEVISQSVDKMKRLLKYSYDEFISKHNG